MYNRYAESARVNWTRNFAAADPEHAKEWMELITPKGVGLILKSITTDYKFVSGVSIRIEELEVCCEDCKTHPATIFVTLTSPPNLSPFAYITNAS